MQNTNLPTVVDHHIRQNQPRLKTTFRAGCAWLLATTATVCAAADTAAEATPPPSPQQQYVQNYLALLPDPVAIYNQRELSAADAAKALQPRVRMMLAENFQPDNAEFLRLARQWVEELVDRELLLGKAAAAGITPPLADVNQHLAQAKQQLGADTFANGLAQEGISEAELVQTMAAEMVLQKWLQQILEAQVEIGGAEVEAYYKQHPEKFQTPESIEISHVLASATVRHVAAARAAAEAEAHAWHAQIAAGADFAAVARQHSQCPSGKFNDGYLGAFGRGQFGNDFVAFEQAVFALQPGQISNVLASPVGYHIVKAGKHHPARVLPLAEVAADLQQQLQRVAMAEKLESILKPLREAAAVEILIHP